MNKKGGFTLIELLAVIVILAIIAVIAVPIVLNIIDETKNNATLRSADFYLDAVEMAVANSTLKEQNIPDGDYNILPSGNVCLKYTGTTCDDELTVEVNGETPTSGTITITSGKISAIELKYGEKTIVKNEKGKLVYQETPTGPTQVSKPQYYSWSEGSIGEDLPSDAKENLSEIETRGYNVYLKLNVDSNNKVSEAYVCFMRNDKEYCLIGSPDGSTYETNLTILEDAYKDVENACESEQEGCLTCKLGEWDNESRICTSGYVDFHDSYGRCYYERGYFVCEEI